MSALHRSSLLLAAGLLAGAAPLVAQHKADAATATPPGMTSHWVKPSDASLRKSLTAEQFAVTQNAATEAPFHNQYWNNHEPGIYVDIVSGEPLFSSTDKFDSHTGWPSFTRPLEAADIKTDVDRSVGMVRTEVRSAHADSHLGHLFDDGPAPTGLRYCMNSAAMRFIPVGELAAQGYSKYLPLFSKVVKQP